MPRSENQKLKLLYLKELFETQSDEQHILSMQDIVSYLAARGIRAERKSVYGDIACLQEFGMDIVLQKGPGGGYFLASRPFELAELKLLAGAVQASKFLSERKSVALIEKLSTLCSSYQAAQLERQVTVRDRVKSMNESIYYTVDRIHEAIARNLFEMSRLTVPVIAIVTGEGNSGGALALGVANRVLMLENSVYAILSPEGFASILWKDSARHEEACELMKLTAPDLLELGVIDGIIPEPEGGAHLAPAAHMRQVDRALSRCLAELSKESGAALAAGRYQKFRRMGAAPQKEEA